MQQRNLEPHDESDPLLRLQLFVGIVLIVIPFLCLVVLFTTNLSQTAGKILGVGVPQDSSLIVYEASCRASANGSSLYIVFWTDEASFFVVDVEDVSSAPLVTSVGINTFDVTLLRRDADCPSVITVRDVGGQVRSAGAAVEVLE